MKLVNGYKLFDYAKSHNILLPAFNTTNYELTYGIIKGLQESGKGGIIQVSSSNLEISGPELVVDMVNFAMKDLNVTVPISLHLDHGASFEDVRDCIDAGFTSIMIDASHLPFEENINSVRQVVEYCHFYDIPVEAELGAIGGKEEAKEGTEDKTNPDEVYDFVKKTGCDILAVSVGNVHGFDVEPEIDFDLLEQISNVSPVPLVFHGGSGIPFGDIKKARHSNLIKVNYGADLRRAFISTFGEEYKNNPGAFDVKTLSKESINNVSQRVKIISNSINS